MFLGAKNSLFGVNPANSQPVTRGEQLSGLEILENCLQTTFSIGCSWVSHGAAPPPTCTQAEEKAVSPALLNTSWTINDHMIRTPLFSVLKGNRHLEVCASTVSCGAHAGSGRHGKGGMTTTGGPDPTRHAHTGHVSDVVDELTDSQQTGVIAALGCQITAQETRAAAPQTFLWSQAKKTWPCPQS